ncbi:helix-turn-helix domain-containing protein [Alkalihalobacterium chitinilyticum]|uniref:Helix-turn-helix domain-containing protein n=1 Tax=Alkalihalobacterium chitinilyticum TaxID=2980103 RepID=A0ABT5VGB2_9BACI|nr:helix-turn-helix transcriptional regulator [Alkalihalobacterium chitinilyticum]MDE5413772.1 helix-turn-helix domain-containing protein [Alkalihalobacterium chitinilyticum]
MNGGNIRQLRQKKGMSLDRLSELSGVSKSYLSYIERGLQTNPSISVLEKMSQALGVELLYLIEVINTDSEGEGEKHPTSM